MVPRHNHTWYQDIENRSGFFTETISNLDFFKSNGKVIEK